MFKKPLGNLKTSSPLKNSERKKLRQRVLDTFSSTLPSQSQNAEPSSSTPNPNTNSDTKAELGDVLVPPSLLTCKFLTHLSVPGVAYLHPTTGDPLWFTLGKDKGKGSDDGELIPSVYTLWKFPALLPVITTPERVIEVMVGGADLMIPGVVQYPPDLMAGQLVAIAQYHGPNILGPPLAVGRLAPEIKDPSELSRREKKGKAVLTLHTWKDCLWELGKSKEVKPPPTVPIQRPGSEARVEKNSHGTDDAEDQTKGSDINEAGSGTHPSSSVDSFEEVIDKDGTKSEEETERNYTLSPEEISQLLYVSFLQFLSTLPPPPSNQSNPGSSSNPSTSLLVIPLPIPATTLYTTHILPSRPSSSTILALLKKDDQSEVGNAEDIDVKHSSHKSLTHLLKKLQIDGLCKFKETKPAGLVITFLAPPTHPEVAGHRKFLTIAEEERKRARREAQAEKDRELEGGGKGKEQELRVEEWWKPSGGSVGLFGEAGTDTSNFYTTQQIRTLLQKYIADHSLANPHDLAYVTLDPPLRGAIYTRGQEVEEFIKRDELMKRVIDNMQAWHRVTASPSSEGESPLEPKRGLIHPIHVLAKPRSGRAKACTFITNFEPFRLSATTLSSDLRKLCAGSTTVTELKPGHQAHVKGEKRAQVLVQGKQVGVIVDWLVRVKGVPRKWVLGEDLTSMKSKGK